MRQKWVSEFWTFVTRARSTCTGQCFSLSCTRGQYTTIHINTSQILVKSCIKHCMFMKVGLLWDFFSLIYVCVLQWSSSSRSGDVSGSNSSGRRTDRVGRRNGSRSRSFNWSFGWKWYELLLYITSSHTLCTSLTHTHTYITNRKVWSGQTYDETSLSSSQYVRELIGLMLGVLEREDVRGGLL